MFFFAMKFLGEKLARKNVFSQQKSCRLRLCCTKNGRSLKKGIPVEWPSTFNSTCRNERHEIFDYATIFKSSWLMSAVGKINDVVFCDILYKKSVIPWGERWPDRQGWGVFSYLNEEPKTPKILKITGYGCTRWETMMPMRIVIIHCRLHAYRSSLRPHVFLASKMMFVAKWMIPGRCVKRNGCFRK